jgi:DNA-binding NtrC family response regulator
MPIDHAESVPKLTHVDRAASFALCEIQVAYVGNLVGCPISAIERELIIQTLESYKGNRTRSAKMLGISIRSLRDKIRCYRNQGVAVPHADSSRYDDPQRINFLGCH